MPRRLWGRDRARGSPLQSGQKSRKTAPFSCWLFLTPDTRQSRMHARRADYGSLRPPPPNWGPSSPAAAHTVM
jgi:hypothetical protein